MLWSEFGPYVMPYVIGVPEPMMALHVRLAAIEFCRRTLCDIRTLEGVLCDGASPLVELEPEQGTQIIKIKAVEVAGKEWPVVDARAGLSHARSQSPLDFAFTEDNISLSVYPLQAAGVAVVVDAALAPSLTAASLSKPVAAKHAQDIAHGAVASLKRIPKQPFTDPAGAADEQAVFNARVATVAAKVSRGMVGAKMRSHIGFV